jgi:hypothetical protein
MVAGREIKVAHLGDHDPYTRAGRLYGRPHQAGHEFASGIGREKREPIRRLVELGLKAKKWPTWTTRTSS